MLLGSHDKKEKRKENKRIKEKAGGGPGLAAVEFAS